MVKYHLRNIADTLYCVISLQARYSEHAGQRGPAGLLAHASSTGASSDQDSFTAGDIAQLVHSLVYNAGYTSTGHHRK